MKNISLVLGLMLSTFFAFGQNIPDAVKTQFAALYPNTKATDWDILDGMYEVSFIEKDVESSVLFSSDGRVLQTETEMEASLLPQAVKDYVGAKLPGKKIEEASKIVRMDGKITYEVEVDDIDYLFDSLGTFLKQEAEDEDDEDDEDDEEEEDDEDEDEDD